MTINDFLKAIQKEFGHVEYKATSKDGQVFKSKGWRDDKVGINQRQFTNANRETKNS
jgi:hypothetical protein